ncbi:MAG: Fic family protein [Lachnospiraceae bacterium]|nr:Fic family protein [Lachnospiraceae bacterium]
MGFKETIEGMSASDKKNKVRLAVNLSNQMLIDSIWSMANMSGMSMTSATVSLILNDAPALVTKSDVFFCDNARIAWNFLINNLEYNNCWMLMREFNKLMGRGFDSYAGELRDSDIEIEGTSWKPSIPYIDSVHEQIWKLNEISDPVEKAIGYFCYIMKTYPFTGGNRCVAILMANKILVSEGIGVMSIPVHLKEEFNDYLNEFYEGDGIQLRSFLESYCIVYV